MTIGIAVSGPKAGLAAFRGLAAVEAVGRGAIRGFVAFAAIDEDGKLIRAETQNGGTKMLFGDGDLPTQFASAPIAALMSSGPDRPAPLSQFVAGDPAVGLVTGHRLPNMPGVDGRPMNEAALSALAAGMEPPDVIAEFQAANPGADAGIIVVNRLGQLALGNSAAVDLRDDKGQARYENTATGLRIGVLHNLIFPAGILADLAVSAALDAIAPADTGDLSVALVGGRLALARENALHLDGNDALLRIDVAADRWLGPAWEGSPVLRGAAVHRHEILIGRVVREPYCVARNGIITGSRGGDVVSVRLLRRS